jgi:hypothetical protein
MLVAVLSAEKSGQHESIAAGDILVGQRTARTWAHKNLGTNANALSLDSLRSLGMTTHESFFYFLLRCAAEGGCTYIDSRHATKASLSRARLAGLRPRVIFEGAGQDLTHLPRQLLG